MLWLTFILLFSELVYLFIRAWWGYDVQSICFLHKQTVPKKGTLINEPKWPMVIDSSFHYSYRGTSLLYGFLTLLSILYVCNLRPQDRGRALYQHTPNRSTPSINPFTNYLCPRLVESCIKCYYSGWVKLQIHLLYTSIKN